MKNNNLSCVGTSARASVDVSVSRRGLGLCAIAVLAGCSTPAQLLDSMQPQAIEVAVKRGQFELACPQVTSDVLNRQLIEPAIMGPAAMGLDRAEYTIGIAGCGKRSTYVVICPEGGDGCFAGEGRGGINLRQ